MPDISEGAGTGVDTSIYSKLAPVQQANPLALVGQVQALQQGSQQIQSGQLNNQLLGMQVRGKQAVGQIISKNTDPQGNVNWSAVSSDAGQNPDAAPLLPEIQKMVIDQHIANQQLQGQTLDTQAKRQKIIGDTVGSLLGPDPATGKPTVLTPEIVSSALTDRLLSTGYFSDPASLHQLTAVQQQIQGMDDPHLRKFITQIGQASDMTADRIATQYAQQNGGLTPAAGQAPTKILAKDANGNLIPSAVSLATFSKMAQAGPVPLEAGMTAQGVPLAQAGDQAYTVNNPSNNQPGIVTKGEAASAAAGGRTPAVQVTGPVAGTVQAANAAAESNVQQSQALQKRASIVPQRRAALSELAGTLNNFTPGPRADMAYQLNSLAAQAGVAAPSQTQGVAAQDEFNKLAAQIALDQWGTLGGTGSNEQLATTMHANPNAAMSKLGIKNVVALLQGNEDAIQAQNEAWQKYSAAHGPASYGDFITGWNRYYDPRVFQAQHMDPGSAKQMVANMSPSERKTYERNQTIAQRAGWIGGQ